MPRFDQSFTGLCEQNLQDTLQLKQRYLDAKSKRVPKSKDKKQQEAIQSSVHVQQKFLKRPSEDHDPGGANDNFEPPVKLQCTTQQHNTHQNEGLTKFSVEIVQQLEFTTSSANSQPQQISTNVTVKAHTNASVKSDVSSPKSNPSTPVSSTIQQKSNIGLDVGALVECVKQEPENDFADLDQCAAALEKDAAANGGTGFGGFSSLIGDDTNDEIISDAFNDLISDISNYPELMKDFDFEDKSDVNSVNGLKVEDIKDLPNSNNDNINKTHSPIVTNNQNYSPPIFDNSQNIGGGGGGSNSGSGGGGGGGNSGGVAGGGTQATAVAAAAAAAAASSATQQQQQKNRLPSYSNMDFCKTELSPAAQTLKQMAEQHQHKNQMGMSFNPTNRVPTSRSPYPDFQFNQNDYHHGSPNSNNPNFHKNSPNFPPQADMIKQEIIYQGNDFDSMKRKNSSGAGTPGGIYKQQYSPYSSPSASSHGSPGYLPRGNSNNNSGNGGPFGGGTPPRPPSGPGGGNNNGTTTLQINQAQQLHISQQSHGHVIQVSAGQHLHLSGDIKGNVSIATQQGMHFNQHSNQNQTNQNTSQQNPLSGNQNQHSQNAQQQQQQMHGNGNVPPTNTQQHTSTMNSQQAQQQQQQQPSQMGSPIISGEQQMPNTQMGGQQGPMGSNNMQNGMGGMPGPNANMMGGPGLHHPVNMGGGQIPDGYSMSQSQTINFTQQTLRQKANGPNVPPNTMGPNGPMGPGPMGGQVGMGPRMMNHTLEQQKLLHQQQMLRAQQAMQQHMVRPPPPDYKSSAGLMQGMQPRYGAGPPTIRRMPHQPMPPSGPMMRHNMYMLQQQQQQQQQQQHMVSRNMYPRQQTPMTGNGMDSIHGSTEWRHLLMSQQQNTNFNQQIRPNLQQGFNLNSSSMQLSAMQQQQIRTSQGLVTNNLGQTQVMGQNNNPMSQMNNMSQQMLHMQQQQNLMQQNSQMSLSSLHMQQSQSMSMTNQQLQPQQSQQQPQQNLNNHQIVNNSSSNNQNSLSNFNSQPSATDFSSLDFLDNLPTADTGAFTDQELLNSFDSDSGFNLDF